MNTYVLIGIIGSISSVVSLLIAAPTVQSRVMHGIYGFLLTVIVGSAFLHNQTVLLELESAKNSSGELQKQIDRLNSLKSGAENLAESYFATSDIGRNRGFILSSFAFLEKNKDTFPESYAIAKQLIIDGLKITNSAGKYGSDGYEDEKKRMDDGAEAMRALLRGISVGPKT
ncbi:hypothetical protein [Pseudoalteromonas pernae]|uniref:hypothetical protein n=1 Tax=Pseudoalteromonas pernae TaxID=3118054 RepID=UPI003242919A